jgi:enamine deaminase RidA (YjgF/YER057c/UK114 family)
MNYESKISEMGFSLPEAPTPLAAYVAGIISGNLVFTAGQVPLKDGKIAFQGKLGKEISVEDGQKASQICCLNCLSVVKKQIGDLQKVKQILKVTVFVASSEGFTDQPKVANGASEMLVEIFGEKGKHVRSAVGVSELPLNSAVEIEMIVEFEN